MSTEPKDEGKNGETGQELCSLKAFGESSIATAVRTTVGGPHAR